MKRKAVFLDRDGTIIEDVGYVSRPDQVRLLPGAAEAIRRLRRAGYLVVIVSNQSGVARGLLTEDDLETVHQRMIDLLAAEGATIDGTYYCPFIDGKDAKVAAYRRKSLLRKPEAGMLLKAAEELDIDLARSWMIGDADRDMEAGRRAGCRSILLRTVDDDAQTGRGGLAAHNGVFRAADLLEATDIVETQDRQSTVEETGQKGTSSAGGADDEVVSWLRRISEQLDRDRRSRLQDDFSLLRMFGTLVQMFAIVTALWGVVPLFAGESGPAVARFCLAIFLQLAAVTAFVLDRWK